MHGSLWEFVRNTAFDARDWNATSVPAYHENQFGAAVGLPILRNKLFLFADVQANRIAYTGVTITTVPSLLERTGNFSELLQPHADGRVRAHPAVSPEFQRAASAIPEQQSRLGHPRGCAERDRAGGPQPASATEYQQRAAL